jgi:hypothetical protein
LKLLKKSQTITQNIKKSPLIVIEVKVKFTPGQATNAQREG